MIWLGRGLIPQPPEPKTDTRTTRLTLAGKRIINIIRQYNEADIFILGRRQVADSAQFKRLAFVSLSRDHNYAGLQEIQNELSSKVMELAPSDLPRQYKVIRSRSSAGLQALVLFLSNRYDF